MNQVTIGPSFSPELGQSPDQSKGAGGFLKDIVVLADR